METLENMLKVTYHTTGKLEGLTSINTSSLENNFCKKMASVEGTICSHCYARRQESYRPSVKDCYSVNSKLLSNSVIEWDKLPYINALLCRYNSYGELINVTHFINLLNICIKNKHCTFVLWTKRPDIIETVLKTECKPDNLRIIRSSVWLNIPQLTRREVGKSQIYDKLFTVYDRQYAKNCNIKINCSGRKCKDCMLCYTDNDTILINELVK